MADLLEQKRLGGSDRVVTGGLDAGYTPALRRLMKDTEFSQYVNAGRSNVGVTGRAAELNAELDLPGNKFPLDLLVRDFTAAHIDGDTVSSSPPWVDLVFSDSLVDHLGYTRSMPPDGTLRIGAITSVGTPEQRGREQSATTRTQTVTETELIPKRNSLHLRYAN